MSPRFSYQAVLQTLLCIVISGRIILTILELLYPYHGVSICNDVISQFLAIFLKIFRYHITS